METWIDVEGYKMIADCSEDVLCRVTIADLQCTYCSPSAARVLGWTPDEMEALFPGALIHPEEAANVMHAHARYSAGDDSAFGVTALRVRCKDGSYARLEVKACLMRHPQTNEPWQVLLNLRDLNERMLREQQLEALTLTDALTGLGNRRAFDQALEREWRRARREHSAISLLLLDVDNFKSVNDTYGHQTGDQYLRRIGEALASVARRPGDLAARYGGEELTLILPATDLAGATLVAEQVRAAIQSLGLPRMEGDEESYITTVSVGVATASFHPGSMSFPSAKLLRTADDAMYRAKQKGRNRVETALLPVP